MGVVLIYGSWNFPYVVNFKPLACSIASGNCAVIKPSELSPHSSNAIQKLVEKYLDRDCFEVVQGGPEIAAKISTYKWDLICFTGSTMKGKLVAEAAGKNLVPCVMELGGKCPIIVDTTADLDLAAKKICFGRFGNSGQTCIAPDYVLVHESKKKQFLDMIVPTLRQMYGESPNGSPDMGKIIADYHCDRIKDLIDTSGGKIICGGKNINKSIKYVEPTIIVDPNPEAKIMQEEIFGPVLPIISYKNFDEVINLINEKDKPLAVYYFGNVMSNPNKERLLNETSSGCYSVNEVMMHGINDGYGFGGVGASGYGRYSGYEGFKNFSNPKSVLVKAAMNFGPFKPIVPPFNEKQKE